MIQWCIVMCKFFYTIIRLEYYSIDDPLHISCSRSRAKSLPKQKTLRDAIVKYHEMLWMENLKVKSQIQICGVEKTDNQNFFSINEEQRRSIRDSRIEGYPFIMLNTSNIFILFNPLLYLLKFCHYFWNVYTHGEWCVWSTDQGTHCPDRSSTLNFE